MGFNSRKRVGATVNASQHKKIRAEGNSDCMDSDGKDQVPCPPPIWAQVCYFAKINSSDHPDCGKSRQEVCESLNYFRSYHSGVYFNGSIAKGYLLSAFAARYILVEGLQ